ncbi:MAG: NADP-dependent oxidoreductase [Pseudomonadota bacterium]
MSQTNRQWILKTRPTGLVGPEHFELKEAPIPTPGDGEILLRSLYFSFDPTQRGWLNPGESYIPPVEIGEPMRAGAIGQVVASNKEGFAAGDIVQGTFSWQEYVVTDGSGPFPLTKLSTDYPLTYNLSIYGITGLTAFFGLREVGKMKAGDVVLVSGAAGATGSVVGQIAKAMGAKKVVGIAGGPDKCKWLVEEGGFDAAIDYKSDNIAEKIGQHCPDGVNVFFDNVGGASLDAALLHIAEGARVVICGGISSGYSGWDAEGPRNYMMLILRSASMEGFLVLTYGAQFPDAVAQLAAWQAEGKIQVAEYVVEGFENAPTTLQGLFTGKNLGKTILKVSEATVDA